MDKIAVVTGGSGNLGPIWVETLEEMGYKVFIIDLPEYDITVFAHLNKAKAKCLDEVGIPSVIINSAAIDNPPGSGASFFGNCGRIFDVNLGGAVNVTSLFLKEMIANGGGVIINIGSIMGNVGADWRNYPEGFEKPVGYNLSKAALIQFSRSLCVQYGRYNIRSVTISFGPYDGGKLPKTFFDKFLKNVPLGRTISKESLKATLRYAIECPELSGQQVLVDAGYCVL